MGTLNRLLLHVWVTLTAALAWPGDTRPHSRHLPRDGAACQGPHPQPGLFPALREKRLPQDSRTQQQELHKVTMPELCLAQRCFSQYCGISTHKAPLGNGNPAQNNGIHPSRPRKNKPLPLIPHRPPSPTPREPSCTWLFLQPEASFLPSGDQAMLSTQCR